MIAKFLLIAEFAYNNAKNLSTNYTSFKLNCGYYLQVFFKENTNPCFKFKSTDKLLAKLQELMTVYHKNIHHIHKL